MKKLLFTTLILAAALPALAGSDEEFLKNTQQLEQASRLFYEAPMNSANNVPIVDEIITKETKVNAESMPVFKRYRIQFQNYLRARNAKIDADIKAKEEQAKLKQAEAEQKANSYSDPEKQVSSRTETPEEGTLQLAGEVKEHVSTNDMTLDADIINYDEGNSEIEALGRPVLNFPAQEITLKGDRMIYNAAANVLKAYGNVELLKDGEIMRGDFMQINANEETSFLDNLKTEKSYLEVTARNATSEENKLTLNNGKLYVKDTFILNLQTSMVRGTDYSEMIVDPMDQSLLKDDLDEATFNVVAKEIYVDAKKAHDVIKVKDATIYMSDRKLFKFPSFTAHTDKGKNYFEANYPEFGSRNQFGMFAGPGFVFDIPNGATIKAIPVIASKSGTGIGGFLKYRSANNYTDFGYATPESTFVLRGRQELDDKLYIQYGMNSYMDDWFLGYRLPKYMAEVVYKDSAVIKNSLKEGLDLRFNHRVGFGYMYDSDHNVRNERLKSSDQGTVRGKYMAQIDQSVFSYKDIAKRRAVDLSIVMQGSAAVYGTGDTQFIGRIGPKLHTQYRYWMQDLGYFATAYQDNTPLTIYDTYRYGHNHIYLQEALRVNKYLTLAWRGSYNPTKNDSPNGKMMQECTFFVTLGPDDFKFTVGYDVVREQTYFTLAMALDMKDSSVEFEKMEIKNPDRLSSSERGVQKVSVFEDNVPVYRQKMKYAEVIEIEDPDKERIE